MSESVKEKFKVAQSVEMFSKELEENRKTKKLKVVEGNNGEKLIEGEIKASKETFQIQVENSEFFIEDDESAVVGVCDDFKSFDEDEHDSVMRMTFASSEVL